MKKLRAALVLMACLIMCGCAAGEDSSNEPADDKEQPEEIVVDNDGEEPSVEDNGHQQIAADYSGSIAWSDDSILDIDNGQIIYRLGNGAWIYSLAASKDTVYAIIGSDAGYDGTEYRLIAFDRLGDTEESEVMDKYSDEIGMQLGYYDNTFYLCYSVYDGEWNYTTYAYEAQYDDQSNVSMERTKDGLCEVLDDLMKQGYSFCYDFDDFMTCLNEQNILFLKNDDSSTVASFNVEGDLISEYVIEPAVSAVRSVDGKMLVESCTGGYYIYSLEGDSAEQIGDMGSRSEKHVLGIKDGYIYYYTSGSFIPNYSYWGSNNSFYRYDPVSGTESLLFETMDIPGQPYVQNGIEGFTVWEDKCYFINFDEGCLWWFACDLSDDDYALTRLGIVDEYRGIFDVASVGYEAGSYECDICGEIVLEYYVETPTLYAALPELEIPYADQINAYLQERIDNYTREIEEYVKTGIDYEIVGEDPGDHTHFYESRELGFDGVTQFTFLTTISDEEGSEIIEKMCLEVDLSGYEYYGGAHGYPIRIRCLFDLQDGSLITFGDICGISEDEFRRLAAEYTVQDYQENGEVYFETDEDSLYETVYDYAGFDCLMHLGPKGVVIEYSPYHLGPYAAGYIEVTIPYKDLGLALTDIYGVNVGR